MEFSDWIRNKFLEWERERGSRQSYSEFARYLGVKQTTLSQWMRGGFEPKGEYVDRLAVHLGTEIYGILGIGEPDPLLLAMNVLRYGEGKDGDELRKLIGRWLSEHGFILTKKVG